MNSVDSEIAGKVANGAAWLDENFPGWEREIDLGTLDMESCHSCICGQSLAKLVDDTVMSGYDAAVALGANVGEDWVWSREFVIGMAWAVAHGFSVGDDTTDAETGFDALEKMWLELIKERFSTGNLSDDS